MLDKRIRKHFLDGWKGVELEVKAVEVSRTKNLIRQTFKDLALLAEKLPEKHLADTFTADTIMPFVKVLVRVNTKTWPPTDEEMERIKRLRPICRQVLHEFAAKSAIIAHDATRMLIGERDEDRVTRLTALLIGY